MPTNHSIGGRTPDEVFFQSWEIARRRGFWRFVFANGATGGVISAAVFLFQQWLVDHVFDPRHVIGVFLVFVAAGWILTPLAWWKSEARYKDLAAARAAKA